MEEWKQINDYPNYSISSLGQVRRNDKIRKPSLGRGYLQLSLCKNGILKNSRSYQLFLTCRNRRVRNYRY